MKISIGLTALMISLSTSSVSAGTRNDLGYCTNHIARYLKQGQIKLPERELTVLIDQTVLPDQKLKQELYEKVIRFVRTGDKVNVIAFSAYAKGHYSELMFSGVMERPLPDDIRGDIPIRNTRKFDKCLKAQWAKGRKLLLHKMKGSFSGEGTNYDFTHTELIGTLNTLATGLISKSPIENKTLLIFSDMLENSRTMTFFSKGKVRTIDPARDIKKVTNAGMIPNLEGVKVYVIGGGWLASGSLYQDSVKLSRMKQFWGKFFALSKASLEGFGEPLLMIELE